MTTHTPLLTEGAKRKLRLCKVYKAAAATTFEDIFRNKWKMVLYMIPFGCGTMTMVATMLYYLFSQSDQAVQERTKIKKSLEQPIRTRLYQDFLKACPQNPNHMDITTFDMVRYIATWNYRYIRSKLYMTGLIRRKKPEPRIHAV